METQRACMVQLLHTPQCYASGSLSEIEAYDMPRLGCSPVGQSPHHMPFRARAGQ